MVCKTCGKESEFREGKLTCRLCENSYQRSYYQSNIELMRKRKREWMKKQRLTSEGRDRQRESQKKCWNNGRSTRQKIYLETFKVRHFFVWRCRLFNMHYGTSYIPLDLFSIWKHQRGICPLTGIRLNRENCHLDHILPIARGGDHKLSNIRWVTKEANFAKRDMTDDEFFSFCNRVANWLARRISLCSPPAEPERDPGKPVGGS